MNFQLRIINQQCIGILVNFWRWLIPISNKINTDLCFSFQILFLRCIQEISKIISSFSLSNALHMPPSTLKTQLAQTSHALHDSSDGTWVLLQNFNLVLNSLLQDLQVACRGILQTLYLSNTHREKSRKATGLKTWRPFREKGHESVLHIEVSHLQKLTKIPINCGSQ